MGSGISKRTNSLFWLILSAGILVVLLTNKKGITEMVKGAVRGVRNKNPYNLRVTKNSAGVITTKWIGLTGEDDKGFCVFDTMENGVRAGTINLRNGYFKKGLNLRQIIAKYAPASDNNNEEAYVKNMIRWSKGYFTPEFVPKSFNDRVLVCKAIIYVECGGDAGVTDEMIMDYVN